MKNKPIRLFEQMIALRAAYPTAKCEIHNEIRNTYLEVESVGVFPAIPVSAAFEIGRRYMPGVYPVLKIYDDDNGFFEAITIGG